MPLSHASPASSLRSFPTLICWVLALAWWGVGVPSGSTAQSASNPAFFIEAEDYNYNRGQTLPLASVMPYLGGAYAGLSNSVSPVDYSRPASAASPLYRQDVRVPITESTDTLRDTFSVTQNFRLSNLNGNEWFNYTRSFPPGRYLVYAAMSNEELGADLLQGSLAVITTAATNSIQTTSRKGAFKAAGTGSWDVNRLVGLKDTAGRFVVVDLTNSQTLRFTASKGWIDYLKFVVARPPVIRTQPVGLAVTENQPANFTITLGSDDFAVIQWQTNRINVARGTNTALSFVPTLANDGLQLRCVLTNSLGTTVSEEVTLQVLPDTRRPVAVSAINLGQQLIRLSFSEPVSLPVGPATGYFTVSGGLGVASVAQAAESSTLDLTLASELNYDQAYVVTVSGVADRAADPNLVLPGSTVAFTTVQYVGSDVGRPGIEGGVTRVPGGFKVVGAGMGIGGFGGAGTSDQFGFSWEPRTGDFDIQARLATVHVTDPFLHAGLMARETLATNSPFAAAFASSIQLGCFFEVRKTAGAATTVSSGPGGVPVNYPETWLRLRRVGNAISGFGSLDGQSWVLMGINSFTTLTNTLMVGFAVSGQNASLASEAEFRNVGPTVSTAVVTRLPDRETLVPSSRRTGLVFSEIMYSPKLIPGNAANLEFIEIYNAGHIFEELRGYTISGGVSYRFPDTLVIEPGQFMVIAADPAAVQAAYGLGGVLGPWQGSLNNAGDLLQLRDGQNALKLELAYSSEAPWPPAADGSGPSLVLSRPSYGENDARAWSPSREAGGNPGGMETWSVSPFDSVVINELRANVALPEFEFVELYNHSNQAVDLGGCFLTDDPATNKFRIPDGALLAARGFLFFDDVALGFSLSSRGETIYLMDRSGQRVVDTVRFQAQEAGVALGRFPDGGDVLRRLATATPGLANAPSRMEQVVINEIMYNPITQNAADEYVELYNRGAASVDVGGWRFVSGIDYVIPAGTLIGPDGYLVIAKDQARLISRNPQLNAANTVGNFSGLLADGGERLALARPASVASAPGQPLNPPSLMVVVSEVTYSTGGRWGKWSDGGGSSLELIDSRADLLRAASWADSDESAKSQWIDLSVTNILENGNSGYSPTRLHVTLQGAGEALVDEVDVRRVGGTNQVLNGNFQSTNSNQRWQLFGTHSNSTIDTNGGFADSRCLHICSQGDGDTGVNGCRRSVQGGLSAGVNGSINAKARWLAGWPEVLFRLQGGWLELPGRLPVPTNLGTPGLPNSRRVANAGPAIFAVKHAPALPRGGQPVVVTCQVADPDGLGAATLRYRYDPTLTLTNVVMRDDGTGGDEVSGDGIYSGTMPGRTSGLAAFRVEASDAAVNPASSVFPAFAPAQECLIRWGDSTPFGSFAHYHLWNTAATESARGSSSALNNLYRDATLVNSAGRIIYNAGFRDKGSPYHSGVGDFAITVPVDDMLLGVRDRVFGATGNGGAEETGLRGRVANWFQREMGLPYLNSQYILFYRNGGLHQTISEDAEQPNNPYAESWFPSGEVGELFKIAVWFEDDSTSGATSATMEQFRKTGGDYDLKRYRFNWQLRPNDSANNYTNFLKLVDAINASGDHVPGMMAIADMEEWMRVFAYHRVMGNWDSWTYNVGQNMYLYRQPGAKWVLIPWDIDFVLGLGGGPTEPLWGGQDPVANSRIYDNFTFRRMLYRSFLDAINGPMLPSRYGPQIEQRRLILAKNRILLSPPAGVNSYIDSRRDYLKTEIAKVDVLGLSITNNSGTNYVSSSPVTTLTGTAPFSVARIEVNGIPYPIKWTGYNTFSLSVPLGAGSNVLTLVGLDLRGNPVAGSTDSITAIYNGVPLQVEDFVGINEIHYNTLEPRASFIEIYNRSSTTLFDLSNFRLDGVGYVFPEGSLITPSGYWVLAKSKAGFSLAYGSGIPVWDEFPGSLSGGGERLSLVKPGATSAEDVVLSDVRYDNRAPWPISADGTGPSLQLIDESRDSYRVGNWAATSVQDLDRVTPGRANSVRQSIPSFPLIWLNEVLPGNQSGPTDNAGELEPFVELYNSGDVAVDLSPYFLTDNYTNLVRWAFPDGTALQAKSFLRVWLDGEEGESVAGHLHASFRLSAATGSVALVRQQGIPLAPVVMDFINYEGVPVDRSVGDFPDGEPRGRRSFYFVTPGAANNPVYPDVNITINEVMAVNQKTLADTANGKFSDWIELFNAGSSAVDLTGYRLSDSLTNRTQFVIPSGYVIPSGGFLLVWADGDPSLNTPARPDLHANFKLSEAGEDVALFSPDDRLVDGFGFGPQIADFSLGRYPDGANAPLVYMPVPTPRKKNDIKLANLPPAVVSVAEFSFPELIPIELKIQASDPNPGQTLAYSLTGTNPAGVSIHPLTGVLSWAPSEEQGPGLFVLHVKITDDGLPASSVVLDVPIRVLEVNRAPVFDAIVDQVVVVGQTLGFTAHAVDPDLPVQSLVYSLAAGAPLGAGLHPDTGGFTWTPSAEQAGQHLVTLLAKDSGIPPLTQSIEVNVDVREATLPPAPLIQLSLAPNGDLTLFWAAVDGVTYRLEYKDRLSDPSWIGLRNAVGADGVAAVDGLDTSVQLERYYRVTVSP